MSNTRVPNESHPIAGLFAPAWGAPTSSRRRSENQRMAIQAATGTPAKEQNQVRSGDHVPLRPRGTPRKPRRGAERHRHGGGRPAERIGDVGGLRVSKPCTCGSGAGVGGRTADTADRLQCPSGRHPVVAEGHEILRQVPPNQRRAPCPATSPAKSQVSPSRMQMRVRHEANGLLAT